LWNSDRVEMNFPSDYPTMPGEPKRVHSQVVARTDETIEARRKYAHLACAA
jgi:hypothetical protein